jgi:DNA-binding SARP family transcriptional activator
MISEEAFAVRAEFGLLGPLSVRSGAVLFGVPAPRQRIVLAALAVRARRAVSSRELAEMIWDGAQPAKPQVAVRNYVSRLRQVLGPAGLRIVTCAPGYLLDAADDEVDVLAFTRLCREGGAAVHAAEWTRVSDVLGQALSLWRGAPLADIPSRTLRDEQVPVLESLRLQATEWQLEAGLRLGWHSELVPELEALTREQPLHERFRAQLMLALYRCGRQAEALAAYRNVGQLAESLHSSQRALDLAEAVGHLELRATASNNVGYGHAMLGDFPKALAYCQRALDLHRGLDSPSLEATTWDSLGYVHHHLGDYQQATQSYLRAIGLWLDLGARYLHAQTLSKLGDAHYAAGNAEAARDVWQQALSILDDLNHSDTAQVRARLQTLDRATAG